MIPILERHGGMVDNYIGDGLIVLFGAPDDQPDQAERAVHAAIAMVSQTHARVMTWVRHAFPDFRIGVVINTGPALVGMIGSRRQLDYTTISEAVNTAARIELANRELHSEIIGAAPGTCGLPA
jgi:adenylate cyclase